jgi:hypothetical protein
LKYYKSIATYYENPNSPTFHDQLNEENLGKRLEVDREIHSLTNLHEKISSYVYFFIILPFSNIIYLILNLS